MKVINKKVLVACHDTGAANALAAFLKEWRQSNQIITVCSGNAIDIFSRNNVPISIKYENEIGNDEVARLLNEYFPGVVLLGANTDVRIERSVYQVAKNKNIPFLTFVDFWENIGAHFSSFGTCDMRYLPDAVLIVDDAAKTNAIAEGVPGNKIKIVGNPFWDYLRTMQEKKKNKIRRNIRNIYEIDQNSIVVLLVFSIFRKLGLNLGFDERDFCKNISHVIEQKGNSDCIHFVLKPHPKDLKDDFYNLINEYKINVTLFDACSGIEAVLASDCVIGEYSSILFEAALLGKKTAVFSPIITSKYRTLLNVLEVNKVSVVKNSIDIKKIINEVVSGQSIKSGYLRRIKEQKAGKAIEELRKIVCAYL